jgi:hypothetical protein
MHGHACMDAWGEGVPASPCMRRGIVHECKGLLADKHTFPPYAPVLGSSSGPPAGSLPFDALHRWCTADLFRWQTPTARGAWIAPELWGVLRSASIGDYVEANELQVEHSKKTNDEKQQGRREGMNEERLEGQGGIGGSKGKKWRRKKARGKGWEIGAFT